MEAERPPWPERIMSLAHWWARWSTCRWMQTGAVVVDEDFAVLVSGFNGPARGQPHCYDIDQPREAHQLTCLHSEMNCILQAARTGVSLRGGRLYSLHRPCIRCVPHIIQVGIVEVRWRLKYETDQSEDQALKILGSAGIKVSQM